jgi:hypothetical protein
MSNKLIQMQALEPNAGWNMTKLNAAFEKYCALWEQGTISKEEAARLCTISIHRFDGCLRKTGKYQKEVV